MLDTMHDQPTGLCSAIHERILRSEVGTYRGGNNWRTPPRLRAIMQGLLIGP
jgi:hypothetical protein